MGQTLINNTDPRLNESITRINELTEKFSNSIDKLTDSANKFSQSSARIERALVSRHSTFKGLFWLLMLIMIAVAILYFTPSAGVKPYVDQTGAKIGLIANKVASKIAHEVDRQREPSKAQTQVAGKYSTTLSYPAYPAYPPYPVDKHARQQPLSAQATAKPVEPTAKPAEPEQAVAAKPQDKITTEARNTVIDQHEAVPVPKAAPAQVAAIQKPATDARKTDAGKSANPVTVKSDETNQAKNPALAARVAAKEHKYGLAIGIYESYLDAHPEDADAWGELGNVQLAAGRPYEAAQNYYEASTRQIDHGQVSAVYPVLPIIVQYQPQLASILNQKMARMNFF